MKLGSLKGKLSLVMLIATVAEHQGQAHFKVGYRLSMTGVGLPRLVVTAESGGKVKESPHASPKLT